jgi:hypothetical protein
MRVFLFLCFLSVLNIALGYALAVLLGFGPRRLRDAWFALGLVGNSPKSRPSLADDAITAPYGPPGGTASPATPAAMSPASPGQSGLDSIAEYGGGAT